MALMKLAVLAVVLAVAFAHGHGGKGKGGRGPKCGPPPADFTAKLDAASQTSIANIWATYDATVNANCSQQFTETKAVFDAYFQAKAGALTGTAKTVYDQIQAIKADTTVTDKWTKIKTLVDAQEQSVKDALNEVFPPFHRGGRGKGKGNKSSEESAAPSA